MSRPVDGFRGVLLGVLATTLACGDAAERSNPPVVDVSAAEPRVAERLETLRADVEVAPASAAAWGRYALSLQAHDFPEAAIEAYARASAMRPEVFAYVYLPAALLAERGDGRAGDLLERARSLRPDYTPLLLREADWLISTGRGEDASELLAGSAAEEEAPARTRLLLARAALAAGDTSRGRQALEAAVEAAPDYGDAHRRLAELYRASGNEDAAELARRRARAFPEAPPLDDPAYRPLVEEGVSSRAHIVRGQSRLRAGDAPGAVEEFREATRIQPADAHGHLQLGTALEASGRREEAREAYERALELRPGMPEAALNAARLAYLGGDPVAGVARVDSVLAADSANADAWLTKGMLLQGLRRPDRAAAAYVEGLRRSPFDPRIAIRLAWILATSPRSELRNGPQAVALAEQVTAIEGYRDPASLDVLGAAYAEFGDAERATAAADRALALARQRGRAVLADAIAARRALYAAGRPYRE